MENNSVFFDEWLRSLRAQYQHVARSGDAVTLPSLTAVMQQVGFREDELRQLRLDATLHVDDVADGFAPDLAILNEATTTGAHPTECLCPECAPIDESRFDAEGQPLPVDPDAAAHESGSLYLATTIEPCEAEPVTFEDSLEPQPASDDEEPSGTDETALLDDPDAPQQTSLF